MAKEKKTEMTLDEFQVKERNPIWEIFNFNSNIPISLYSDSTGVKVPESVYRGIFLSNSSLSSENYLLNAKRSSIDLGLPVGVFLYSNYRARASFSFRHLKEEEEKEFAEVTVPLPKYKHIKMALGTAIRSRRSIRKMSGEPLSLKDLSTILFYAGGVSGEFNCAPKEGFPTTATLGDDYISKVRNAPSGGGLYPVTLFLIIQNVEGLENGLYSYLPLSHELKRIKVLHEKDINELHKIADWGPEIDEKKINVMTFYVYSVFENSRKYNDMGLLFGVLEAGEISQNIHLVTTAMDLAPCDIGGYHKVLCEKLLGVDGMSKHVIHLTIIGNA